MMWFNAITHENVLSYRFMNIKKIVSGGQTGVDSAALDVAMEFGIPAGGWVPKGMLNEYNKIINSDYNIQETPSSDVKQRTEWNVRDADATLIIYRNLLMGGTEYTRQKAIINTKPYLLINLSSLSFFEAVDTISNWFSKVDGTILNIAGPRDSEDMNMYMDTRKLLSSVFKKVNGTWKR